MRAPLLADSLDRVADEVADLVRLGDQLQAVISRLAAADGAPDAATLVEAQSADLLSQRLSGLAGFVRALADAAPSDLTTDIGAAISALTLAEQIHRLSAPCPHAAPETAGEHTTFWD